MNEPQTKKCQNCSGSFVIEPEDFDFYRKIDVPAPTFCPDCRLQRRLAFRNERHLYKRECDLCRKQTLTTFSPDKPRKVYCGSCWWSDAWDPLEYGRPYDPNRMFFEQLNELLHTVPLVSLGNHHPTLVNSEYINESSEAKNCYLIFDTDYCEGVLYGERLTHVKDSLDLLMTREAELCYEDVNCRKSSRLFFSEECISCIDVYLSNHLSGCQNCFGCTELKNKSYYLWNEPLSREEYARRLEPLKQELATADGLARLREKALAVWRSVPHKFMHGFNTVNVSGDYLYQSKNARNCFQCRGLEDGRYCQFLKDESTKDAYDYTIWGANVQSVYECINVGAGVNNAKFCYVCALGHTLNTEYSVWCIDVANIFGCSALRNKKYCILNKQYTPEQYKELVLRIKEQMNAMPYVDRKGRVYKYGEFFPYNLSFYAYNETNAQDYFPIDRAEAERRGWLWRNELSPEHPITMDFSVLPQSIHETTDDILQEVIRCSQCQRGYRIVRMEIDFLRRFDFPVPRMCPECRHARRSSTMNPMRLWHRTCMCEKAGHAHQGKCPVEFETSYAPDRKETVYCEECYQAEVA
jgi:hypothetical protein